MVQWLVWSRARCNAALRRTLLRTWTLLLAPDPGQGLVEYGLILLMIVVVCIAIVTLIGNNVSGLWYKKIVDAWPS